MDITLDSENVPYILTPDTVHNDTTSLTLSTQSAPVKTKSNMFEAGAQNLSVPELARYLSLPAGAGSSRGSIATMDVDVGVAFSRIKKYISTKRSKSDAMFYNLRQHSWHLTIPDLAKEYKRCRKISKSRGSRRSFFLSIDWVQ
ncbi:hypothetical protein ACOME3_004444 [Neoechinorhynchus agilis]